MDTDPRTTPQALAEFNRFYSTVHVGEVIAAHPGFVSASRFELVEGDLGTGPRWLAIYGMQDEAAAEQYVKDNARPWLHRRHYSPWPAARKKAKTVWRMLWRQLSSAGSTGDTLYIVGTNAPNGSDVAVARLELYREFAHPAPGCPRFCEIGATPSAQDNEPVWRLRYRLIPGTHE